MESGSSIQESTEQIKHPSCRRDGHHLEYKPKERTMDKISLDKTLRQIGCSLTMTMCPILKLQGSDSKNCAPGAKPAIKQRKGISTASWNIHILLLCSNMKEFPHEQYSRDIVGLAEVRWSGYGRHHLMKATDSGTVGRKPDTSMAEGFLVHKERVVTAIISCTSVQQADQQADHWHFCQVPQVTIVSKFMLWLPQTKEAKWRSWETTAKGS